MKTIFKYRLDVTDEQVYEFPLDAEILTVGSVPCADSWINIWARVDDDQERKSKRVVKIRGTGHDASDVDVDDYVGTVVTDRGLVWHVFVSHHIE